MGPGLELSHEASKGNRGHVDVDLGGDSEWNPANKPFSTIRSTKRLSSKEFERHWESA